MSRVSGGGAGGVAGARGLVKEYRSFRSRTRALNGIDLEIGEGEAFGLLGAYRLAKAGSSPPPTERFFETVWNLTPKYLISPLEGRQFQAIGGGGDLFLATTTPGLVLWASAWLLGFLVLSVVATSRREL